MRALFTIMPLATVLATYGAVVPVAAQTQALPPGPLPQLPGMSRDESVLAGLMVRFGKTSASVLRAQQATPAWAASPCATATYAPIPVLRPFHYPTIPTPGVPRVFGWIQGALARGCGRTLVLNAAVVPGDGVHIQVVPVAPGTTATDPYLGKDVALQIQPFIRAQGCTTDYVADTSVAEGGPGKATWRESWAINACGHLQQANVQLISNAAGTQITISMRPEQPSLHKS